MSTFSIPLSQYGRMVNFLIIRNVVPSTTSTLNTNTNTSWMNDKEESSEKGEEEKKNHLQVKDEMNNYIR